MIFGSNTCSRSHERTHKRTNQQTRRIAIPRGGGNKIILLAFLLSEISWLAFRTPLRTDRMHHNIREVNLTPTSRRCNKIGLSVEGLITWEINSKSKEAFLQFNYKWTNPGSLTLVGLGCSQVSLMANLPLVVSDFSS